MHAMIRCGSGSKPVTFPCIVDADSPSLKRQSRMHQLSDILHWRLSLINRRRLAKPPCSCSASVRAVAGSSDAALIERWGDRDWRIWGRGCGSFEPMTIPMDLPVRRPSPLPWPRRQKPARKCNKEMRWAAFSGVEFWAGLTPQFDAPPPN